MAGWLPWPPSCPRSPGFFPDRRSSPHLAGTCLPVKPGVRRSGSSRSTKASSEHGGSRADADGAPAARRSSSASSSVKAMSVPGSSRAAQGPLQGIIRGRVVPAPCHRLRWLARLRRPGRPLSTASRASGAWPRSGWRSSRAAQTRLSSASQGHRVAPPLVHNLLLEIVDGVAETDLRRTAGARFAPLRPPPAKEEGRKLPSLDEACEGV